MRHPWLIVPNRKKPNRQASALNVARMSLELPRALYEKAQRMAEAEDRSASSVIRRLLTEAPEPESKVA